MARNLMALRLVLGACVGDPDPAGSGPLGDAGPTCHGEVAPVLVQHCGACHTEREVALKSLQADTAEARRSFWHEARVTATLDHPAIMPVYDAGTLEGAGPYFAMKRVAGRDLYQLVPSDDAPPVRLRLALFLRVCDAAGLRSDTC